MTDKYFFGCWTGSVGHYLHNPVGRHMHGDRLPVDFPLTATPDACFLPPGRPEEQGVVRLWWTHGWVVAAWWDRTVDTRPRSNAAFIMRSDGGETFEMIFRDFETAFPEIAARYKRHELKLRLPE